MQKTPTQTEVSEEQVLKGILAHRTSELAAFLAGLQLAARTPIGLAAALAYALVGGFVGYNVLQLGISVKTMEPAMIQLWGQIALAVGAFTGLYGMVQFFKRDRVSRASWWPAIFAVPALLVGAAFQFEQSGQGRQLGPVILTFFLTAWSLLWMSFGGAAAAIVWLRSADAVLDNRSVGVADLMDELRTRLLDVTGAHAARVHAVTIGMQFVLPGIFYALQLAFTDMIAVLDPERPSLRRSGQLTTGMRGRLFRLMFGWWALGFLITIGVSVLMEGGASGEDIVAKIQELILDPSAPSQLTFLVTEVLWSLLTWVLTLALLVLYREREAQVKAKTALKKLRQGSADAANPFQPPGGSAE